MEIALQLIKPVDFHISLTLYMSQFSNYSIVCATALLYCLLFCIAENTGADQMALLEIKSKITRDPQGFLSSWNDTVHLCDWHGVTCGQHHGRATILDLQSSQLTGTISPYIGNLSFLKELHLQNNSFSGILPREIGRLHRLQLLLLRNNSIGGQIPSNISSCSNLIA